MRSGRGWRRGGWPVLCHGRQACRLNWRNSTCCGSCARAGAGAAWRFHSQGAEGAVREVGAGDDRPAPRSNCCNSTYGRCVREARAGKASRGGGVFCLRFAGAEPCESRHWGTDRDCGGSQHPFGTKLQPGMLAPLALLRARYRRSCYEGTLKSTPAKTWEGRHPPAGRPAGQAGIAGRLAGPLLIPIFCPDGRWNSSKTRVQDGFAARRLGMRPLRGRSISQPTRPFPIIVVAPRLFSRATISLLPPLNHDDPVSLDILPPGMPTFAREPAGSPGSPRSLPLGGRLFIGGGLVNLGPGRSGGDRLLAVR